MNQRVTSEIPPEVAARFFETFAVIMVVMVLVVLVGLGALMFWGILQKAGRPGWWSLIPVYQWGKASEIAGKPAWWGWTVGLSQVLPLVFMVFIFRSMPSWITSGTPPETLPGPFLFFPIIWLLAIAGFVFQILIAVAVARAFGRPDIWVIGLVLLPYVFYPIIGLGSSVYAGPGPHQPVSTQQALPPLPPPYPTPQPPPPPSPGGGMP